MLIGVISYTDRTPTDWRKLSQPQRFGTVSSRLRAGRTRLSAGCVRLCAGYNGRALAGAGAYRRTRRHPPRGNCGHAYTYNRLQKFLSKIYGSRSIRQITQITPHNTSVKPTITDHTTSVIDVYLRFRAVLSVIIQVSRFYTS